MDKKAIELTEERPYVLIREARTPGAWGRGRTEAEAAKNVRANGAVNGKKVYVCAVDPKGCIDEMGSLLYDSRGPIYHGTLHNTGVKILGKDRD